MRGTPGRLRDREAFFALAGALFVCCAMVGGAILFLTVGWQFGIAGLATFSLLALVLAWGLASRT